MVYADEFMYFYGATDLGYGSDGKLYFWYNITSQSGVTGWVRSDLVSISGDRAIGSVWDSSSNYNNRARTTLTVGAGNDSLNIRSWPQHDSALVGVVYNYEVMYFYGQTGIGYGSDNALHEWYYITTSSGVSGWVRSDLVTVCC